ncbi:Transcription factor [Niveomyces insectorum RCEF 264]|uniref:Transcription factor n=1 Tax=Niveomyces insectorum RCEF 264 TaxID=1081102 RepID=A0A167WGM4_9HYPO|nr:Transcription factor [Niveomyces insectorum RCEF 264]
MNLPALPRLRSTKAGVRTSTSEPGDGRLINEVGPSCDNSPKILPEDDDGLPQVPIRSVYRLTKMSALRSPDASELENAPRLCDGHVAGDFVSRGQVSLEVAEHLFRLYMDRLDAFMYGIGGRYQTLGELRRSSRILTVCILTIAALHDGEEGPGSASDYDNGNVHGRPTMSRSSSRSSSDNNNNNKNINPLRNTASGSVYSTCMKEFRRLMAASLFSRHIDRDYLRALCIASYWLSDMSWTLSGYAIRRAAELNLAGYHRRAVEEGSEDAVDSIRLWYVLYICDQHLSTLYARPPIIGDDAALRGWEAFVQAPAASDEDRRLVSQVALLNIVHNIRELFGPDTNEPVPPLYVMQIATFARQLDRWLAHWSAALPERHERIGGFPRKGVLLHYHFATLHLHCQVFRGLVGGATVPAHFIDSATAAVTAATAIINLLITDPEMPQTLAGMPAYMHSMTAFASMFLAKLAMKPPPADTLVHRTVIINLTARLVHLYRSTSVGRWHLVNLMADGLERIVETMRARDWSLATSHVESGAFTSTRTVASIPPGPTSADAAAETDATMTSYRFENGLDHVLGRNSGNGPFNFDANFLLDNSMMLGASPLMYFSGSGVTDFDAADLSPKSFFQ